MTVITRDVPQTAFRHLLATGIDPIEARIFAARGISDSKQLEAELQDLLPYHGLKQIDLMAARLAEAIAYAQPILIIADYDADGATACAVALRGLRMLGAKVDFLVPNRFAYGYGLTPALVDLAATYQPKLLLTVDNGIASIDGAAHAKALGMEVLITDHHLPADSLPDALIVNPNQPGCNFASKHLAGVGVMFYVLLALRALLRQQGAFDQYSQPKLADLLDLVALGTIADVVVLDHNNRILVQQGLKRIRSGHASVGVLALFEVAKRDYHYASVFDLAFGVAPRLNAAGRLQDMRVGIQCLSSDDAAHAHNLAGVLDDLNQQRRQIESTMQDCADQALAQITPDTQYSLCVYDPSFHQGVIGILAGRLKERYHRPALVFADVGNGSLKASGRSIAGLHLRDALDKVAKERPGLLSTFGGHAKAAGLSLIKADFEIFRQRFEAVCRQLMTPEQLEPIIETDGELPLAEVTLQLAERLESYVWGQGFPCPQFYGRFRVLQQRLVAQKHLKLRLQHSDGMIIEAMHFQQATPLAAEIQAVYKLAVNEYRGKRSFQLLIEHCDAVAMAS